MIFNIGGYNASPDIQYLFSSGNVYSDITGGWHITADNTGGMADLDEWLASDATVMSKKAEFIAEQGVAYVHCTTGKAVDMTDYKTLSINVTSLDEYLTVYISNSSGTAIEKSMDYTQLGTFNIDISSLSGSYTIKLHWYGVEHGGTVNTDITVTEIKMTK